LATHYQGLLMAKFPRELAAIVAKRWDNIVAGDYITPPCPPIPLLRQLCEVAYLAANAAEEGRFPRFNLVALPDHRGSASEILGTYLFDHPRPLTVEELRRLAPAVDLNKSAVFVKWGKNSWSIAGLLDLGTSWSRARIGLGYRYHHPACLFIRVDRPGRVRVYQGGYHVATLSDGRLLGHEGITFHLSLHEPASNGLGRMEELLQRPQTEAAREWLEFEFIAIWNAYVAIVNLISMRGHGGSLIIGPPTLSVSSGQLRAKYAQHTGTLRSAFVQFLNLRHTVADLYVRQEQFGKGANSSAGDRSC
jgi:hypothetical protein